MTLSASARFQQLHAKEKDFVSACGLLGVGVEFTRISGAGYTQILFLLSKAMVSDGERIYTLHPFTKLVLLSCLLCLSLSVHCVLLLNTLTNFELLLISPDPILPVRLSNVMVF